MIEFTYTLRNVMFGAGLLGIVGGILGSFAFLRRQSLLGDALAHAALPGVCVAFVLAGSKSPFAFLVGAMVAGIMGALLILTVVRWTKVKEDSAIGIVLSVFFGVGIVLLTMIQRLPGGNQSGLDRYLFGQAASLVAEDIKIMSILATVVLGIVFLCFKEFKMISFDRAFGASLGFPVRRLEILLTALLVIVVVIGLQTVGVVLMVATLITPAAAARQWTDHLSKMVLLSGTIGGLSGAGGAIISASAEKLPTGPVIVLFSSSILVISLLFAPARGIFWAFLRERAVKNRIHRENLLRDLHLVGERLSFENYVPSPELAGLRGRGARRLTREARRLVVDGLLDKLGDSYRLTAAGVAAAGEVVRKHRLWEVFLSKRLELPLDHLHRDADSMEHALSAEAVDELDERLGFPTHDPHGRPIPRSA